MHTVSDTLVNVVGGLFTLAGRSYLIGINMIMGLSMFFPMTSQLSFGLPALCPSGRILPWC
jgi:hypothetical protein